MSYLEKFLFDVIGILVPGFVLVILLIYPHINIDDINRATNSELVGLFDKHTSLFTIIFITGIYIIGTVVKVLAISQYEICSRIFDPIVSPIKKACCKKINSPIFGYVVGIISYIFRVLEKIFTFTPPSYSPNFEGAYSECSETISGKLSINSLKNWYPLYKLSTVIIRENSIPSLTERFLAKYNFYRSMAFVFLCAVIYYMTCIVQLEHKQIIIIALWIFWYCFHYKFKRYWVLCGDDALMSLLCYLKRQIL